ncbi:MAG TPA: choice-of-anchor D domain-containing protein [Terriglobales bacterium]|nr:choice-of-anchor D domain-containing protein [Terriglobales bacterium]
MEMRRQADSARTRPQRRLTESIRSTPKARAAELVLAMIAGAFLSGCAFTGATGSQNHPSLLGTLAVNPSSVAFGTVPVGGNTSQSVTFSNTGSSTLTISQASFSSSSFSLSGVRFPMAVSAGQSIPVQIQFAPQQAGDTAATLSLTSDATNSSTSVALKGTGAQPILSISPGTLAFGTVSVGSNAIQNVTLTNAGNSSLTVTAVNLSGPASLSMSAPAMPVKLAGNQSVSFPVQFAPTAAGSVTGSLSFSSNAPGSPATLGLSGTGALSSATLDANPASIGFGNVPLGSQDSQTITLQNAGTSNVSVSNINVTGSEFTLGGMSLPLTLQGGQSASFTATFKPATAGTASGAVVVTSTATDASLSIALSGTGTAPQLAVSPTSVSFGSVLLGSTASQSVTLSNSGTASLTISGISALSAGFSATGLSFPTTLSPGQSAMLKVSFTPTAGGSASTELSIQSNAPGSPTNIPLTGTGVQGQLSASPASVAFGNVLLGGSAKQAITLTNNGSATVSISNVSVSGTGFALSGLSAPASIDPGASSTFTVTFAPTVTGSTSGSVSITSNASNSTLVINLTGTGVQPQLSAVPSSLSFGSVNIGSQALQTVSLTNPGTADLTITQATLSPSSSSFSTSGLNIPLTISPGASSTFTVTFAPASAGSESGSLSLASNAPNSPLTISLTGTGVSSTLQLDSSPSSLNFGNVQVGSNSTQNVSVTNSGNSSVTVSQVAITGSGFNFSGISSGQILAAGQSLLVSVTFTPTAAGSATGTLTITSNATNSPMTVTLAGGSHSVNLAWVASSSVVVGYNVYRGTTSGGPYSLKLNSSLVAGTSFTDTTVQSGQTYYYVVTAVDSSGVESAYSNQASATIPVP